MSEQIERAEVLIHNVIFAANSENARTSPSKAARALDAAGLLVTPAHDAAVAAKALREAAADGAGFLDAATYLFLQGRADHIEREGGGDVRD